MRILFTTQAQAGHFHPLVPLASAAVTAGHDVAFATAASFAPHVEASGFQCFRAGVDMDQIEELVPEFRHMSGIPRRDFARAHVFPRLIPARMLPDLLALGDVWRPDLVVRDSSEFAGCVAAERWGIPHASLSVSRGVFHYGLRRTLAPPMDELRERAGLPPDPDGAMLFRYVHLVCAPPSLLDPAVERAPTTHFIRRVVFDRSGDETLPDRLAASPGRPTVYAGLGTIFNRDVSLFGGIIGALRDEPVNLILTVGRDVDPASFGPQPENVQIERYIPLSLLLPRCDLVVCHTGFGTVTAALEQGLPLVMLPIGADQPENAARCAALGLGLTLGPDERTQEAIRAAVRSVLADASYRRNALAIRDEIAGMPAVEHGVELLERLAREQGPLIG